jgi:rhodanese-related sulfurtransferase
MRPALLLLALVLAGGCSTKTSDRNLQLLDTPDAVQLSNKGSVLFIDPRSPKEFATAHLPNAINMPFARGFEDAAAENIHPSNVVIVYATSAQDVLGVAASKRLMELGYADIYTLRGGLRQWIRAGKPVEGVDPDSIEPPTPSLENLN